MLYLLPFLSVIAGYILTLVFTPKNNKNIKLLLAFSGSFLLSLTVMHLLPEVYNQNQETHHHHRHIHNPIGIFIMLGIIFQIILEYFSKGAEHGHVHTNKTINQIPWLLFFSLCLHALFEGMPISKNNHLAYGIAIHHFPIAIILTLFLNNTKLSKWSIGFFMVAFSIMTPLGTYLAQELQFLHKYYAEISGIVIGILFHISSTIIFETSEGHKFNLAKLIAIVAGVALASLF